MWRVKAWRPNASSRVLAVSAAEDADATASTVDSSAASLMIRSLTPGISRRVALLSLLR